MLRGGRQPTLMLLTTGHSETGSLLLNRNPSSSNKTRTAGTSTCTGFPAISPSSSDNTARGRPEFVQPEFVQPEFVHHELDRPPSLPPHARAHFPPALTLFPRSCSPEPTPRPHVRHLQISIPRRTTLAPESPRRSPLRSLPASGRPIAHRHRRPAPAVGHQPPRAEPPPHLHILPALRHHRSIRLPHQRGEASNLHRHIAGMLHPRGLQTQIAVSRVAQLPQQSFYRLLPVRTFIVRRHQHAIACEQSGSLVVVSGVERHCEILRQVAELRLHVTERTRVRLGTRVRPVHLQPPGGRHMAVSPRPVGESTKKPAHSSAKTPYAKRKVFISRHSRNGFKDSIGENRFGNYDQTEPRG